MDGLPLELLSSEHGIWVLAIGDFYVDTSGAACACTATNTWSNMTATGACT